MSMHGEMCLSKMSKQFVIYNSRGALLQATSLAFLPLIFCSLLFGVQVNGNDETVETQYFSED